MASAIKYNTCLSDNNGDDDEIDVVKTPSPRHAPESDEDTAAEEDSPTWAYLPPSRVSTSDIGGALEGGIISTYGSPSLSAEMVRKFYSRINNVQVSALQLLVKLARS